MSIRNKVAAWLAALTLCVPQFAAAQSVGGGIDNRPQASILASSSAPVIAFLGDSITQRGTFINNQFTVGGTPQAGDVLTLVATSPTLPGSPVTVTFTMTDTSGTTGATGLKAAILANANLAAAGIAASSAAAIVTVTQNTATTATANFPRATYVSSVTGAGATTTLVNTANNRNYNAIGYATWARLLSNIRGWSPLTYNFGVSGYTTAQMLSTMPQMLALRPDVCVIMAGRNDAQTGVTPGPDTTPGTTEYNLRIMYDEAQAANCIVIAVKVLSQTFAEWPAASNELFALQINNWIEAQKTFRKGFYVIDCGNVYDDPTNTTHWIPRTNYIDAGDTTHPTTWGAYQIGNLIAATINAIWPNWRLPIMNVDDVYDAVNEPYGNLLPQPMFTGTGGTGCTGQCSGNLATGWAAQVANVLGSTIALSKTTWPTTGQAGGGQGAQTVAVSGTANGSNGRFQLDTVMTAANFNAGDIVECSVLATWGATTNIAAVRAYLSETESGSNTVNADGYSSLLTPVSGYSLPTDSTNTNAPSAITEQLMTPRYTVGVTPSLAQFWIQIDYISPLSSATVAGTFQFASPSCRKVQSASQ